jgi:hypothetical protein
MFTHHRRDAHQDHHLVEEQTRTHSRTTWSGYEIPKYDCDRVSRPSSYQWSPKLTRTKLRSWWKRSNRTILDSRHDSLETGVNSKDVCPSCNCEEMARNAPNSYAEALYCRKMEL